MLIIRFDGLLQYNTTKDSFEPPNTALFSKCPIRFTLTEGTVSSITCPRLCIETEQFLGELHSRIVPPLPTQFQDLLKVVDPDGLRLENLLADGRVSQTLDCLQFCEERRRLPVVERGLLVPAPFGDRLALVRKPILCI